MSEKRAVSPLVKLGLELGPVVLFFIAYSRWKDQVFTLGGTDYSGFIVITAGFIPLMVLSTLVLWKLTGHLSRMQMMSTLLVVVFGGLTVWLNDDTFFKMKPTIIYALFGTLLGIGLLRGESWLASVMESMVPMTHAGWMALTKRMCGFFFGLAVLNEGVWRFMSTDAWVSFKTFGLPLALFVFIMSQGGLIARHQLPKDPGQ
ncbi:inner membrane-spanning protein YciB [Falsigemmobacter faecalis]|uniref:Inner membrane-spanning protein YciB n=1 Tax=Falsigemmobacter faecalis TaxID=2488730 RepID=A0A3P3DWI4_9RHOB|nr:inner membrane-spanning protein YciB [Falsigemmobacter faecalis]RRH78491.1 septation protein IspZ [Falsigemmobacter faecalis]